MDIQVLVEQVFDGGYRASALTLSAEGATEEEAIAGLKEKVVDMLVAGAKVVTMTVPIPASARFLTPRKLDDPIVQDYLEILAENRRKADLEEQPR